MLVTFFLFRKKCFTIQWDNMRSTSLSLMSKFSKIWVYDLRSDTEGSCFNKAVTFWQIFETCWRNIHFLWNHSNYSVEGFKASGSRGTSEARLKVVESLFRVSVLKLIFAVWQIIDMWCLKHFSLSWESASLSNDCFMIALTLFSSVSMLFKVLKNVINVPKLGLGLLWIWFDF